MKLACTGSTCVGGCDAVHAKIQMRGSRGSYVHSRMFVLHSEFFLRRAPDILQSLRVDFQLGHFLLVKYLMHCKSVLALPRTKSKYYALHIFISKFEYPQEPKTQLVMLDRVLLERQIYHARLVQFVRRARRTRYFSSSAYAFACVSCCSISFCFSCQ